MTDHIELDSRLRLIAAMAAGSRHLADVGTDHGYIPVYLAQTGGAERITASDVRSGPLRAAMASARRYGVGDRISFVLADGLDGVSRDIDTAVIAGMGGETIAGILERAPWLRESGVRLVLQPQTKTDELIRRLASFGYRLSDAVLAKESGRYYLVICALPGAPEKSAAGAEALAPRLLFEKRDPLLNGYLGSLIDKYRKIAAGLERSKEGAAAAGEAEAILAELVHMKEETEAWLR